MPIHSDFSQLLKVLGREKPDRPVLYEFYMNDTVYDSVVHDFEVPRGDEEFHKR